MSIIRAYIIPLLIVLTFVIALLAVSSRIFLPEDMLAPAPVEEEMGETSMNQHPSQDSSPR